MVVKVETSPTSAERLDEQTLLQRLEDLVPILRERAQEAEVLRQIPQATIDDVWASGYLSAFRTLHFGGPGLGLSALANGARIMAHGCASTAWTMVFLAQHTWMFAKANLELQTELLGGDRPGMQAGALGRLGVAVPVDGGYRVTAKSDWNSGVMHAEWVNCKAVIEGDDQVMMVVMPTAEVVIEDVWNTAGLRGTGSNTIVVEDLFVPARRVQASQEFLGNKAHLVHEGEPWASYPFVPVAMCTLSAVALGAAESAVEEFRGLLERRTLAFSGGAKQVDQPMSQLRLGEAVSTLRVAQTMWHAMVARIIERCETGGELTPQERVGIRLDAAHVVHTCRRLLDDVIMPSAGGSSYFFNSPLQRIQRDIEVLKGHAMFDWDRIALLAGRTELGMPPAPTDLI
jgi:3-hydroxy-9,10-secoandrosta-1,3,5(10)-triene-9,17-dione monooxygenase